MANKYLATISIDGEGVLWDRATLAPRVKLSWLALSDQKVAAQEKNAAFVKIIEAIETDTLTIDGAQSRSMFNELYAFLYGYREPLRVKRSFDNYINQRKLQKDLATLKNTETARELLPKLYTGFSKEKFETALEEEYIFFKKLKYSIKGSPDFDVMEEGEAENFLRFAQFLHDYRAYEKHQKFKEFLVLFKLARADGNSLGAKNDFFFSDIQIRISTDGKYLLTSYGKITTVSGSEGVQGVLSYIGAQMKTLLSEDKKSNFPKYRFVNNFDIQGSLRLLFQNNSLLPGHELWDIRGNFVKHYPINNTNVALAEFSPTRSQFIGVSSVNNAALWDLNGKRLAEFKHQGAITDLGFSPDGEIIYTVATDSTAKLWDVSGKLLQTIDAHTQRVTHINILPATKKGRPDKFVTSSEDGKAMLWEMRRKKVQLSATQ